MAKLSNVSLCLLGTFAIEANVGRPIAIVVRSKKARALLAYLAMKQDYQARREELATLFWGDHPDIMARHSLRQCLISLRQDLSLASEILMAGRESIALNAELLSIDARRFMSLAGSERPNELAQAAELWRGAFLPEPPLDIEEFDAWHNREADRLATVAAGIFEALCRNADIAGDGEGALAAADRLVALDPAREDRQRTALKLVARYRGSEAALSRAKLFIDQLRSDLDVAPEAATRALINAIKNGEFEAAMVPAREPPAAASAVEAMVPPSPTMHPPCEVEPVPAPTAPTTAVTQMSGKAAPKIALALVHFWHRRPLAAATTAVAVLAIGAAAVLGFVNESKLSLLLRGLKHNQAVVVLPFAADDASQTGDTTFARLLTHDLIGYLSRFGNLQVISEPTSDIYRDRQAQGNLMADLGVQYAIVGQIQGSSDAQRIDFQLVDTATQTNVWSDNLQRERGDPTLAADEAARGIARMLAIEIDRRAVRETFAKPNAQLTLAELIGRGYLTMGRGTTLENLSSAMKTFDEALRRNPDYLPAQLAVARVQIIAAGNFIDLKPQPDLGATERFLNDTLSKFPNSMSALYSLALLHKQRHEYEASMRLLQRCLELNPSLLPARAQIGDILVRTGQPQKGLDQVLQTMRAATSTDPSIGYWYLYAAEAELELGHDQAALDWALRAETFMPGSPLVRAWLAAIYIAVGDKSNAARYAAALRKMAPDRTRLFLARPAGEFNDVGSGRALRLFEGLRVALGGSPG
jgi:DNA-binding SARP family transcriptional activator/TolB-like protein